MSINETYIILGVISLVLVLLIVIKSKNSLTRKSINLEGLEVATFAGGCFWCMEAPFEAEPGVREVFSGYAGGDEKNPTYKEVSSGTTGHLESIQVFYDPKKVSYERLLEIFWWQIDPTDSGGQFVDRGNQYTSAIFYKDDKQKKLAEKSKANLEASKRFDKPIVTKILSLKQFYKAEKYHQGYHKKNPLRYKFYRAGSGRDIFINNAWNDSRAESKNYGEEISKLTPIQYSVTQKEGTEPPFNNDYYNNKKEGIYVDIVSGEPLFSSKDKFDSGTGWPSFSRPLVKGNIVEKKDYKLIFPRTEIRSKKANSHLGHLFNDGPNNGLRYCTNSASLKFISKKNLKKEGYGEYLDLFK